MYQNEYEKTLERMKTAADLAKDYSNINRCRDNLVNYSREHAMACLQDMIREYAVQINTFGLVFDGTRVIPDVLLDQFSDEYIRSKLEYLMRHIPVYVLLKEGQQEMAKRFFRWLSCSKA